MSMLVSVIVSKHTLSLSSCHVYASLGDYFKYTLSLSNCCAITVNKRNNIRAPLTKRVRTHLCAPTPGTSKCADLDLFESSEGVVVV